MIYIVSVKSSFLYEFSIYIYKKSVILREKWGLRSFI